MLRSLLLRLPFVRRSDGEDDEESEFQPSELDESVLSAHGADVERLDEEIADIEEQAQEFEDARRE